MRRGASLCAMRTEAGVRDRISLNPAEVALELGGRFDV